jgi:HJR/Mrr/RecB family endonuclease/superfamily II DNA or RNA helicase
VRYALQIETKNLITDVNFHISCRWIGLGNRVLNADREGAFLSLEGANYRVPEPLFSIIEAADAFAAADTSNDEIRMASLAQLQSLLPNATQGQLSIEKYLSSFRVLHASAFSLNLRVKGSTFDFDPILFGRRISERARSGDVPISDAEGLLTDHQQDVFATQRFRETDSVKPAYLIERGVYVFLDPSLREAMTVVRRMQCADPEARKQFAQAPQRHLKEALSAVLSDDDVEKLFIETEQYSARVIDVGLWTPPVLPWIKKDPNDWLPEKFGLEIGGHYVVLSTEQLVPLRQDIKNAIAAGEPFVEIHEEGNCVKIPATAEAEEALSNLLGVVKPSTLLERDNDGKPGSEEDKRKQVLIVEENFESLGYKRKAVPRPESMPKFPAALRSTLKRHQQDGLNWLQETWRRGYPGVLLADDMGLGKTLQALAFLACLRGIDGSGQSRRRNGPFLIVAPTGLLTNWEKEHNGHLHGPGLGEICRAYGRHLRNLKASGSREANRGAPALDHRRIQEADWVLTTYETLRDYHMSFAAIPFACAIFDEMQKVKSPTSLLTRAAKAVNSDFIVGLTGTPIENQLTDLWCIMDISSPGLLEDLKSFASKYRADDEAALEGLHSFMLKGGHDGPPPMLRRMKNDELEGLPEKKIHVRRRSMPEAQARVYGDIVTRAKQPEAGPMLETLHMLRGVSLHPIWPPAGEISDQRSFISASARLSETFAILDEIAAKREKTLIFLESLDLQEHLALMIKRRYGLKRRPMQINGDVPGEKRQKLVDEFQSEHGIFDAMILSPRAGGVGLTLTTANHVIHLSRWWNPAVEDQCTDRIYRIGQDQTVHVYYPMAVHPLYGDSSFDELLNQLLTRKRTLSQRMLMPPVDLTNDQSWFSENLGVRPATNVVDPPTIDEIDAMEPTAFERWVLRRCVSFGWEASRTPRSHDSGADGLLVHRATNAHVIIQCKHKQRTEGVCGSEAIDDLLRARARYTNGARLFALTNAERFSEAARERAKQHGIMLISRAELAAWPNQLLI